MKIHKQETTFQPVTIVLESQEEVDQMYALVNYNRFYEGDMTDSIHEFLDDLDVVSKYYKPEEEDSDTKVRKFK